MTGLAQVVTECPQNIGFELASLNNWECYIGEISGTGERFPNGNRPAAISLIQSGTVPGQHTLIRRSTGEEYSNAGRSLLLGI